MGNPSNCQGAKEAQAGQDRAQDHGQHQEQGGAATRQEPGYGDRLLRVPSLPPPR